MSQDLLNQIFIVSASIFGGAIAGGLGVLVIYDRAIKSVLNSPVIIKSLEGAFASLPANVKVAATDTATLLGEVTGAVTTTTTTTAQGNG